ncbi:unnamed protein product, partial [Ilex paraguariensis]
IFTIQRYGEDHSVLEAGVYQQFLGNAIQRIVLSKANLLGNRLAPQQPESLEAATVDMEDAASITDESADLSGKRYEHLHEKTSSSSGTHLSLSFIQAQKHWKGSDGGQASNWNMK